MSQALRNCLVAAGIVLAAVALHAAALGHGFVNWDDDRFITNNPLFAEGGWTYARAALTRVQFEAYHPLHLLSYLPDRWLWPHRAAGFHAVNLALFGLDVLLVFLLARRHAGLGGAAAAALLLTAHPLCVEAADWITGRKDLLATAFFIGVLLIEDRRNADDVGSSPGGLVMFAAALLCKTSTLYLPPIIWCWLVWMRRATGRTATRRALPYALLGLVPAIAVVTIWRKHEMIPERPIAAPVDVLATLATYARRTVWPTDLAAMYPVEMPAAVISAVLVGTFAIAVALFWRRLPSAARFAVVAFLVALLPVANIVPVALRFADRYAFLALAVLVPPAAVGFEALWRGGKLSRAVAIGGITATVVSLATITVPLSATWTSSRTLWARASAAHPDSFATRTKYGGTLLDLHDLGAVTRDEFQAAVRLKPLHSYGYAGLFSLYARRAEEQRRIPSGSERRWLSAFDSAQYGSSTFDALIATVPRSACPECSTRSC